jgi:large subunit ribosomal protein L25
VKNFGGILVTAQEFLEIECLPQNLPDRIFVDISILEEIGDSIYVRDLVVPSDIEVLTSRRRGRAGIG